MMPMNTETNLSSQMQFIILCCKSEMDENDIKTIRENVKSTEHLEEVSMLAYGHGVYPLFYHTLMEHASDLLDREMKDAMAYLFKSIEVTNKTMTDELLHLSKLFEEHDIQALSIKGPALAKQFYGDISLRQFSDLDILVKRENFFAIHKLMSKLGYETEYYNENLDTKALFEMKHDCPYYNPNNGITVEIHWDFFRNVFAIKNSLFEPWNNIKEMGINNQKIHTLSDETHLLFHAVHGSKHRWEKVGWIVDIDRMIRANSSLNWDDMLQKAKKMGINRMFLLGIFFAYKYFKTPLNDQILNLLNDDPALKKITHDIEVQLSQKNEDDENKVRKAMEYIELRDNIYYQTIGYLAYMFKPTYTERKNINLNNKVYILYYPLKFFKVMYVLLRNKYFRKKKKKDSSVI